MILAGSFQKSPDDFHTMIAIAIVSFGLKPEK